MMVNTDLKGSAKMAMAMGILLPIVETVRRFKQLADVKEFFSWFDDYILGVILVWAAFLVMKEAKNAVAYLIAAWGIATGALFLSFIGQIKLYQTNSEDPGIFPTHLVTVAKGLILLFMLIGLSKAIRANLKAG